MSGGFFRGTTADQDTRFSNKQAKLMKSQKFAPELENLVDMTKVKMDVMKPWIAHRVTELLGFEDEVLINFIYGLLEEKVVNGKKIQITLTGFMEKNTGKFMKELWTHLLSAQNNVSGVPREFLDAKAEEARKKKVETDRITSEIQQKKEKEGRELEHDRMKKMDGDDGVSRAKNAAMEPSSRHESKDSMRDEKDFGQRNRSRGRSRVSRSPHVADESPAQPRRPSRSISKSPISRSLSNGRDRSRSISVSPQPGRRSVSSGKNRRSPSRRSATPRQSLSPPRRESSQLRRRSVSRSRLRSPSPIRRRMRSPVQRRSRTPIRRRSRSPMRRRSRSPMPRRSRSPVRRRSRSPIRRRSRSPLRRRSRSPIRRKSRSPIRRRSRSPVRYRARSPLRRRSRSPLQRRSQLQMRPVTPSPGRHRSLSPALRSSLSPGPGRSPSPVRRQSPSPVRRGSPSLVRSPVQGRSPPPATRRYRRAPSPPRRRSPSPTRRRPSNAGRQGSPIPRRRSLSPQERTSLSPIHHGPGRRSPKRQRRLPLRYPRDNIRTIEKYSPVRRASPGEKVERTVESGKGSGSSERRLVSERSSQRDFRGQNGLHDKAPALSPSTFKSPSYSDSSPAARRSTVVDRRLSSPQSPAEQMRDATILVGGASPLKTREDKPIRESLASVEHEEVHFAREEDKKSKVSAKTKVHSAMTNEHTNSAEKARYKKDPSPEGLAYRRSGEVRSRTDNAELKTKDQKLKSENIAERVSYSEYVGKELPHAYKSTLSNERSRSHQNNANAHDRLDEIENVSKLPRRIDGNGRSGSVDFGSEESDDQRVEVKGKRKHKKSRNKDVTSDDDDSHDSHAEERKEAKRRRKEEKRLKKEERRQRRAERRRRRDDRHSEKQKGKSGGIISPPSDFGNNHDGSASDGEQAARKKSRTIDSEAAVSEQKRLEIELREKALESLRAKKGVGH